jgi:hypothetical protein
MPTNDVALTRDEFADLEVHDTCSHGGYFSAELMANGHRHGDGFLSPFVPFINVDIGATDRGFLDFDKDIHRSHFWFWDVF